MENSSDYPTEEEDESEFLKTKQPETSKQPAKEALPVRKELTPKLEPEVTNDVDNDGFSW